MNINRQTTAILENAFNIGYEREANALWTASFSMPLNDDKNALISPLYYVEIVDDDTGDYIGLFRIVPENTRRLASINEVQYTCEHVLSTLLNDVLFMYHQRSNHTTRANIEYILDQQTTKHWRLGDVDFTRYFHYKWENENGLLGPLFSIAEPFDEPYIWTWDTTSYPWTLHLKRPSDVITGEIRYAKNLAEIEREIDPSNIVNRIYPLGYGEGDNALNITRVNDGVPYLEDSQSIATYGLQSYVWVDRRFEDVDSLKSSAHAFLDEWSKPKTSYRIKAIDLSLLTGIDVDKLTLHKLIRVIDPDIGTFTARIIRESKADITGAPYDVELELSNANERVGTTLADIERRQEINEVYAQGATSLLVYPYEDNADEAHPAVIRFKLPDEMVRVNKLELTYETTEFRAYSRAIEGGGAVVSSTKSGGGTTRSTTSGGGTTRSTTSGGGTSTSTQSGGGSTKTSSSGGGSTRTADYYCGGSITCDAFTSEANGANGMHAHSLPNQLLTHRHEVTIPNHTHTLEIPAHTHNFTVPAHSHDVTIPAHSHDVTIPDHTHEISLPNHTHGIDYGIFKLSTKPSKVTIKVDGNTVAHTAIKGDSIDLIPYLSLDGDNRVERGWHEVEITPNGRGRINAQLMVQFFMQSRGGVDA